MESDDGDEFGVMQVKSTVIARKYPPLDAVVELQVQTLDLGFLLTEDYEPTALALAYRPMSFLPSPIYSPNSHEHAELPAPDGTKLNPRAKKFAWATALSAILGVA
ncbi:12005_t:CDS:2, partial [Acaulospora colombiana]